jgi:uncharacterized alkaline shock family protein YloU
VTEKPADRGSLDIADRVVEKVAGHAVTLVPHATAAPRRLLGLNLGGPRPEARADVEARVYGEVATVQAAVSVAWPRSVVDVAGQVRDSIRREVERITGVRVDYVDIEISAVSTSGMERSRVQ